MLSDRVIELDLAARERAHERRRQEKARPKKVPPRRDIQGLRAFAVLAVILDHLTGWPGGGFVGVDIFFVISGFLITGILLRRHEETGSISPGWFYGRRFKRIMPAAALVLVVTTVASYLTYSEARFQQIKGDAIAALFFGANWRYATQKLDYFNADRIPSPVQHYWSLSIEEQFYFLWPWLMVAILAVLLGRSVSRRQAHAAVGAVLTVIVVGSFAWAVHLTSTDSHTAYFSSFTRVWELGVGALLAVVATQLARIPDAVRPPLAWVGLAGMVASLWVIHGDQGFPAPAAALPVLATGMVIVAGTRSDGGQQRFLWPLTNKASEYVGDLSYSLYLWHFPIIIVGAALIGDSVGDKVTLAVAIAVISYFSYWLWEDPLHHATWFGRRRRGRGRPTVFTSAYKYKALAAFAIVTVVAVVLALRPPHPPESALAQIPIDTPTATAEVHQPQVGPRVTALQKDIRAALTDTSWPDDLSPSMDDAIGSDIAPTEIAECAAIANGPAGPNDCAWGPVDAPHTAVLVGDSVAMAYADALRAATLAHSGWRFLFRGATACPFADVTVNVGQPTANPDCPNIRDAAVRDIKTVLPDVLFVVNHEWAPPNPTDDWVAASQREISRTGDTVGRVVYVGGPPPAPDPADCYTPGSSPTDCTGGPSDPWRNMLGKQQALATSNQGIVVDTEAWYCFQSLCPPYVDKTPVRPDGIHVLPAYTKLIQPVIDETLDRVGVFRR